MNSLEIATLRELAERYGLAYRSVREWNRRDRVAPSLLVHPINAIRWAARRAKRAMARKAARS